MKNALTRYRVMANVVGVTLLVFVVLIIAKYSTDNARIKSVESVVAVIHGWLFFIYLFTIAELASRARFRLGRIILMALSGMVPFLSFVMERRVTIDVRRLIAADPEAAAN